MRKSRQPGSVTLTAVGLVVLLALALWLVPLLSPPASARAAPGQAATPTVIGPGFPLPAPAAPSNLGCVVSPTRVNLFWRDNATNETEFQLERSTDGVNFAVIAHLLADTTSYVDTTVSPATFYAYRVRAYRQADNRYSGYSNKIHCPTPAQTPTTTVVATVTAGLTATATPTGRPTAVMTATPTPVPPPVEIPTTSEWGTLGLTLGAALVLLVGFLRRGRRV